MRRKASIFLILFLFFLSIYAAVAFYLTTPKPSQPFIGFGIYAQQGLLGYTGPNSTVIANVPTEWTLNVTNEMGSTQFVQVVSILGNQTSLPGFAPNATSPALLPVLTNTTRFVPNQNSSLFDYNWTVTSVKSTPNGLDYLTLSVNGQSLNSTVGSPVGEPFRLFFEVWTYDSSQGGFQYYTWLQVWFSVNG